MNLPYHLAGYKTKIDSLSSQSKSILEFCVTNRKVELFIERLNREEKLEEETIQILKKAILAGYDSSIYTYNWPYSDELRLWELINDKCDEENKVYFILAKIQSVDKSVIELKDLYFKSFDQQLDYVFSIEDDVKEELYNNPKTRYEFLKYDFKARITQWEDFEDNWNEEKQCWKKKFLNDGAAIQLMEKMLNEKRKQLDFGIDE
ncbi:MAG: hypothetical protein AB8F74_14560 [Saprospiraceae bacterium]